MKALFATVFVTGFLAWSAQSVTASTLGFEVLVNTAPLIGSAAGPFSLDFQLIGSGSNTVVINRFNFGGGGAVAPASRSGGASGDLNSGVALDDGSSFFNELFEPFTPGSSLSFFVTMTTNVTPSPDAFSFAIRDGNLLTLPTTGLGDSLALVSVTSSTLTPGDVQTFRGVTVPGGPNYSNVTAQVVPEPASLLLLAAGLAAATTVHRRRRRSAGRHRRRGDDSGNWSSGYWSMWSSMWAR
jgi:hypothetical protein